MDYKEKVTATHFPEEKIEPNYPEGLIDFLQSLAIAIALCVVVYLLVAMPNQIEGQSMEPTLHNGEIILTNKLSRWFGNSSIGRALDFDYNRGDIIVFQKKPFDDFIKRVVGLPGDKVELINEKIFINSVQLEEEYLANAEITRGGTFLENNGGSIEVPEGSYLVLGDNRNNSHDSRSLDIGLVKEEWIKGKVILKYWPINKLSLISAPEYNI